MLVELKPIDSYLKNLLSKTEDEQRFLYYSGKIKTKSDYQCSVETENDIWYGHNMYKLYFVKKMFLKKTGYMGFSMKNKKLQLWNNRPIDLILNLSHLNEFLNLIGCEWYSDCLKKSNIKNITTKTVFQKIITKKITNQEDLIKHYLKYNLRYKDVSHKLFLEFITSRHLDLQNVKRHLKVVKNINHYLENKLKRNFLPCHFEDMVKQCLILNKQIDVNWSEKRFDVEHNEMTKQIMSREIEFVENQFVNYGNKIPKLLSGMSVLSNQRQIFQEGTEMKHCVYTNYLNNILSKRYLIISYHGEQRATIGIRIHGDYCSLDQIQGIGNTKILYSLDQEIQSWFKSESISFSEFARDLNGIHQLNKKEKVELPF